MEIQKEEFLRSDFLTMSVLGALGRSRTYSKSASDHERNLFREALRLMIREIAGEYASPVKEEVHLSNITKLADDLTLRFCNCLENGRFSIGIAQKALNLYLKLLWCVNLIPTPPHCPFDSIVINHLPECNDLNYTSLDSVDDYVRLVRAARETAHGKTLSEWELGIWMEGKQKGDNPPNKESTKKRVSRLSSWRDFGTKFHDVFKLVMKPYKNQVLETSRIKKIIENVPEFHGKEQWIQPSDHCINLTNKGACYCALTDNAIFEQITRGRYRVLQ